MEFEIIKMLIMRLSAKTSIELDWGLVRKLWLHYSLHTSKQLFPARVLSLGNQKIKMV